jgi:hypothetical protein
MENIYHRPDVGGSTYLWNVSRQLFYALIALMMEAARTYEISVDNYFTRQFIPRSQIWTSYSPLWELEISHFGRYFQNDIISNIFFAKRNAN